MKIKGFTLAEVLITLTIIGIVAAIVVPSLMSDINDKVWVSKRAALYSRMSNAIANMEKLNGYGKYEVVTNEDNSTTTTDTASESFVLDGLSKVYKIKRVCGSDNFAKCGPKYKFANVAGSSMNFPDSIANLTGFTNSGVFKSRNTRPTAFETNNGELIVAYYNPDCIYTRGDATSISVANAMCVNFIYDLNGPKNPNQVGKDIGVITAFAGLGISPEVVMPNPIPSYKQDVNMLNGTWRDVYENAISACESKGEDVALPNMWEMASMFLNRTLTNSSFNEGSNEGYEYWTSSAYSAGKNGNAWVLRASTNWGYSLYTAAKTKAFRFYCTYKQ